MLGPLWVPFFWRLSLSKRGRSSDALAAVFWTLPLHPSPFFVFGSRGRSCCVVCTVAYISDFPEIPVTVSFDKRLGAVGPVVERVKPQSFHQMPIKFPSPCNYFDNGRSVDFALEAEGRCSCGEANGTHRNPVIDGNAITKFPLGATQFPQNKFHNFLSLQDLIKSSGVNNGYRRFSR